MVKALLRSFLLVSVVAVAQTSSSITGRWRVHGSVDGNVVASECNFAQNGSRLRGTCTSEQGTVDINGQVKDSVVTWSYEADYNGTVSTFRYTGIRGNRKIIGKIIVDENNTTGEFTASALR